MNIRNRGPFEALIRTTHSREEGIEPTSLDFQDWGDGRDPRTLLVVRTGTPSSVVETGTPVCAIETEHLLTLDDLRDLSEALNNYLDHVQGTVTR